MPPHKHPYKEDYNFSEFSLVDLKQQTESNTYHLSTISKEVSNIKDIQMNLLEFLRFLKEISGVKWL